MSARLNLPKVALAQSIDACTSVSVAPSASAAASAAAAASNSSLYFPASIAE